MHPNSKEPVKKKVFPKGQVVIPVSLRKKFQIHIGDYVEVVSTAEGILLKPSTERKQDMFVTDRLFGIFSAYAMQKQKHTKDDIGKATEAGFTEGWSS